MSDQPTAEQPFAAARFDFLAQVPGAEELGRVHFLAIGGAGMSGVARIMLARGMRGVGSDAKEVPVLTSLASEGATVWVGFDEAAPGGAPTVVMSSSIRDDNVELVAARGRGARVLHRAQALASLMHGQRRLAVAGANGKTTTTSLLAVALQGCGLDPSFAAGGELARHGTNAHQGTDDVFVVEADESDGSFLVYRPDIAIVTNVQPDHLDFYGSFTVVQAAYDAFARTVRPGGLLVTCADDAGAVALAERARSRGVRVLTYGFDPDADVVLRDHRQDGLTSAATLVDRGVSKRTSLGIPGRHNALNAGAAYAAAVHGLGQDPAGVLSGLASFTGTRRRFEPKGEAGGVVVIDDYAHNAGKVAAVVETAAAARRAPRPAHRGVPAAPLQSDPGLRGRAGAGPGTGGHHHRHGRLCRARGSGAGRLRPARRRCGLGRACRRGGPLHALVVRGARRRGRTGRPGDLVLTVGAGDVTMIGPEVLRLSAGGPHEAGDPLASDGAVDGGAGSPLPEGGSSVDRTGTAAAVAGRARGHLVVLLAGVAWLGWFSSLLLAERVDVRGDRRRRPGWCARSQRCPSAAR